MKLSEDLRNCRTFEPNRFMMDRFIRKAKRLENDAMSLIRAENVNDRQYDKMIKVIEQRDN